MADTTRYRGDHTHVAGGTHTISGRAVVLTDAADPAVQAGTATAQTLTVDADGVTASGNLTVAGDIIAATNPVLTVAASDATTDAQNRADYVCDGTADEVQINAAITALGANGGAVLLSAGNFYIDDATIELPQGCYLQGAGRGATILQTGASHTLTADTGIITLTGVSEFAEDDWRYLHGGVKRLHIKGDGGKSSFSYGDRPDGTATVAGIDASLSGEDGTVTVENFEVLECNIEYCKQGFTSGTTSIRFCPIDNCQIRYCDYGVVYNDHVSLRCVNIRCCTYGAYGTPSADSECFGTKFALCDYGLTVDATTSTTGMNLFTVTGCQFANIRYTGIDCGQKSNITGCVFIVTSSVANGQSAIAIRYEANTISGNRFVVQGTSGIGWTLGCIYANSLARCDCLCVCGNYFENYAGPVIGMQEDPARRIENTTISGNTFRIRAYPLVSTTTRSCWWRYVQFTGNHVLLYANLTGSIIALPDPDDGGVQQVSFVGNTFRNNDSHTLTAVFDMDLDKCVIANNVFDGFSTVIEGTYSTDKNTVIRDNIGISLTEHGAGAIGTAVAPTTVRTLENGTIVTEVKVDLTGLKSSGTADDVIGLEAGGAAYLGRNVVATNGTIYKVEMACLEVPAGGEDDIILVAGSAADEAYNDTVADTAALVDSTGAWTLGKVITNDAPNITANYYYYLTAGDTTAGTYTAGQFVIRFYGHIALA